MADLQGRRYIVLNVAPGARNIGFHNKSFRVSVQGLVRLIGADEGAAEMREEGVTTNDPRHRYSSECNAGTVNRKR